MRYEKWIKKNTSTLKGKTVAITGATGGLGRQICRYIVSLGGSLILIDRNGERSLALKGELLKEFVHVEIQNITLDLEDIAMAEKVCRELEKSSPDIFIHNAAGYSIPRKKCETGFDNVFQINFVTPYFITRRMLKINPEIKIIAVGSIAHRYSVTDPEDTDFSTRTASSLVYGNSKRYLMCALWELFREKGGLSVVHPGITFTNITAHYPPWLFTIIKQPMKVIFMKPEKAALCVVKGIFEQSGYCEWLGPRIFDIWGLPHKSKVRGCKENERKRIFETSEEIYLGLEKRYAEKM